MSKKKKNRQQKIITDLRRRLSETQPLSHPQLASAPALNTFNSSSYTFSPSLGKKYTSLEMNQLHLKKDLAKTTIITGLIVIGEFFLFYLLKHSIIRFPMVRF